jgi:hypothetical protein
VSAVELATAGDGYEVRAGTEVTCDDPDHYGVVTSLAEENGRVVAAVACEDDVLRAYDVQDLSVFTVQHG